VAAVSIGAFMGQLDASVVSLAFPTLKHAFGATLWAVQWVGLSYLLVLVSLVTAIGRVADGVGRKLLYVYGFLIFIVGSTLCGLAPNLMALDGFRAVQALGAAMMQANSVAIIATSMPPRALGRGIGVQATAQALGLALGPAVGGLLIAFGGWRLIFFINVPIGLVGVVAAWLLVPRSRDLHRRKRFDWPGLALFAPALIAFLAALSLGNQIGWLSEPTIFLVAAAAAFGAGFVAREARTSEPMIEPGLLARPAFSAGVASGLLAYFVLFGSLFVIPFFLEGDRSLMPTATGAMLAALPIALGLVAPLAGRAADSIGARPLTVAGMLVSAGALGLLALSHDGSIALLCTELALLGVGLGLFTPANNATIMAAAPKEDAGMAGGILNMTRGLGTTLGLAVTGLVFGTIAGAHAAPSRIAGAFSASALFLAVVAVSAAALSALRGTQATAAGRR
jgi:EmrB/QacA subfamily drug resistance transporter